MLPNYYKNLWDDAKTHVDYNIKNEATLIFNLRIRSCNLTTIYINIGGEKIRIGDVKHIKEQIQKIRNYTSISRINS